MSWISWLRFWPASSAWQSIPTAQSNQTTTVNNSNRRFPEKFMVAYQQLLGSNAAASPVNRPSSFWHDLFLLKVNEEGLRQLILTRDDWLQLKTPWVENLREIMNQSMLVLLHDENETLTGNTLEWDCVHQIQLHALVTQRILIRALFDKNFPAGSLDVLAVFAGLSKADSVFTKWSMALHQSLVNTKDPQIAMEALRVLVTVLTCTENIHQNNLIQYLLTESLFQALWSMATTSLASSSTANSSSSSTSSTTSSSASIGGVATCALALLCHYKKYEAQNVHLTLLSGVHNAQAFQKLCIHFRQACEQILVVYQMQSSDWQGGGWQSLWQAAVTPSISVDQAASTSAFGFPRVRHHEKGAPPHMSALWLLYDLLVNNPHFITFLFPPRTEEPAKHVLPALLQSFSFVFRTVDSHGEIYPWLCLLILRVLIEHPDVCAWITNPEHAVEVPLAPRKPALPEAPGKRWPLAVWMDVLVMMMNYPIKNQMDAQFYMLILQTTQHVIIYLQKDRRRMEYHWSLLYRTWMHSIRYLLMHKPTEVPVDELLAQLILLFNIVVTHGDAFLPDTASYDACYYEIIRHADVVEQLDEYWKSQRNPHVDMSNMHNIATHFIPHVNELQKQQGGAVSPENIIDILHKHYETLELSCNPAMGKQLPVYREYPDMNSLMKKLSRAATHDIWSLFPDSKRASVS